MGQKTAHLPPQDIARFVAREAAAIEGDADKRVLIGLAGGPGTGKSTLSETILATLRTSGITAALVPMDGFHMRQEKLERLGLAEEKGAPHTFEAQDFVDFLTQLKRANGAISGPVYTRDIEDVTDNAYSIEPDVLVVIVEGNYLLLDTPPWDGVRHVLDLSIHIAVPRDIVRNRLLARRGAYGLFDPAHIARHVETVDLVNYDLVSQTAHNADIAITVNTSD